jgi:endonuclease/exonuclease/phosphatase family metal-dependent hydrolase
VTSKRVQATICAALALMMAFAMAGFVRNAESQGQQENTALRVMTYNIKHGQGNDACEDPEATPGVVPPQDCAVDLERAADVIRAQDPDVIAIQEVDRFWARSGVEDQPARLAELLSMNPCYAANLDHPADEHSEQPHQYGVLILTKAPVISCQNTLFPSVEGWEQRGLLEARIEVEGAGEIAILATHFQAGRSSDPEEAVRQRTQEADLTAERVKSLDVPVILMGDLNARPDDTELTNLMTTDTGLQDAWAVAGDGTDGFTSPASPDEGAKARIDYILVSDGIDVTGCQVVVNDETRIAADHYPVVAELSFGLVTGTPNASPGASPGSTPGLSRQRMGR